MQDKASPSPTSRRARDTEASGSTAVAERVDSTATSASDAGSRATRTSSRTDEEKFIAALRRKFRAREVDPPPPPASPSTPERSAVVRNKCALCRRTGRLVLGQDGRWWCPSNDADACTRIAQGRLGASGSAQGSAAALTGVLDSDGKCRDCGEPVKWVKTQRGKKMPVNVHPAPPGVSAFELVGRVGTLAFYISEKRRPTFVNDCYEFHGATCAAREPDDST